MALDQSKPVDIERRVRDPERTKEEILMVSTQEFAERGFAGARVDEIANQTRTTKRMIYQGALVHRCS
jgi:AcrR family transcriptional regulator